MVIMYGERMNVSIAIRVSNIAMLDTLYSVIYAGLANNRAINCT